MPHRPLGFGAFVFDPRTTVLTKNETIVPLRPQAARVLGILLENAGRIVLRGEIEEAVWPGVGSRVTRTQGLNACIAQIRRAIEEDPRGTLLETLPRRGYVFVGEVRALEDPDATLTVAGRTRISRPPYRCRPRLVALVAVLSGTALGVVVDRFDDLSRARPMSVRAGETLLADAHPAYVTGRRLLDRATREWTRRAIPFLERAVQLAPAHAPALAALATAQFHTRRTAEASASARRALAIDPTLVAPHLILGRIALEREFDWVTARRHLERAAVLAPDAPETSLSWAHYHALAGDREAALDHLRAGLRIDPLGPVLDGDAGRMLFWTRRYGEALDVCLRSADLMPYEARPRAERCVLDTLVALGRTEEAIAWARRLMERAGAPAEAVGATLAGDPDRAMRAYFAWALRAEARVVALGSESPVAAARAHALLGRRDSAFALLEAAVAQRAPGVLSVRVDPAFDSLRSAERFREIVAATDGDAG